MSTAAPRPVTEATTAGGGTATSDQQDIAFKITSQPLLHELKSIYGSLIGRHSNLSTESFRDFLLATQHEHPPSATDTNGVIPWVTSYFGTKTAAKLLADRTPISFDDFLSFITSANSNAIAPPVEQDLTQPLTSYFISSSHNTYLVGNQLYGASTAAGYINVLKRGCRCIEIDVWDGENGEPEVLHGHTLTKEISFKAVCEAIGTHAFEVTDLPLIVSVEVHAGLIQQGLMVEIMRKSWGGMLVEGYCAGDLQDGKLPSPDQLRKKILIKVKYTAPPTPASMTLPDPTAIRSRPKSPLRRLGSSASTSASSSESELEEAEKAARKAAKKAPKSKVGPVLANLGVYTNGRSFRSSFSDEAAKDPKHVFSFSEKAFTSLHQTHSDAIFTHNKTYFSRVYPFALRIGSTNPDPTLFWARGVQLVALNWQKVDGGMMVNEGMFSGYGGFVLKPPSHRPSSSSHSVSRTLDLKIQFIAAQNLPLPEKDVGKGIEKVHDLEPYVKVALHIAGLEDEVKRKTKAMKGCDVSWGSKGVVEFKGIKNVVDCLSFARFKIMNDAFGRDDLSSWCCIRLDRLRSGYRLMHLFDAKGQETSAVILVKIEKTLH